MIALSMVVRQEFANGQSQVPLSQHNHAVEALGLDGVHKTLRVRVRIGRLKRCLHHTNPRVGQELPHRRDRKSTRLNSSHVSISYAVFCLKKKKKTKTQHQ